ncbi:putative bifunctional diguanylate cyclase/phosphodiesterase [Roseateles koreensis]|uniref:EAL domain-containing protein n=1 Tax=Roseateles koreensis TaxID=2987526 RepID=A0ABT5KLY4_9BURK|nr:EAL domain-containing protein [Roseateles koreensis]MDC8783913.1 EAL domain-containing protein [Roseateles koreensis]
MKILLSGGLSWGQGWVRTLACWVAFGGFVGMFLGVGLAHAGEGPGLLQRWGPHDDRGPMAAQLLAATRSAQWCTVAPLSPLLMNRETRLYRLDPPHEAEPQLVIEDPIAEVMAVLERTPQGCLQMRMAGRSQPQAAGMLASPFPNLPLVTVEQGAAVAQPVWVLLQDVKSIRPWLSVQERAHFSHRSQVVWLLLALYAGMLVMVPVVSLALGVLGQARLAGAYIFYVSTLLLWLLENFSIGQTWFAYWPAPERFAIVHGLMVGLLILGTGVATAEALRLEGQARRLLSITVGGLAALFAMYFLDHRVYQMAALSLGLMALAVIALLLWRWPRIDRAQRLFSMGLGATMLGGILQALTIVLPEGPLRDWGLYAFPAGNFLHALFWVAALNHGLNEDRKARENQLRDEARHDPVTGLANRKLLEERIHQALRLRPSRGPISAHELAQLGAGVASIRAAEEGLGAVFVDLDRFKILNDSLGHTKGDVLLCQVAQRLVQHIGSDGLVARFGGDEFFVLVLRRNSEAELALLGASLLQLLDAPLTLDDRELRVSASLGIVVIDGSYTTADDVIKDADLALHHAKQRGRARFELFEPPMRKLADQRFRLESELRVAIERGEFEPFFQPIVALPTTHHAGFEALVRWRHPQRGLVSPAEFIPAAEDTGLIEWIGMQVMQSTMRQVAAWRAEGLWREGWYVSVNVSGVQLRDVRIADKFAALLRQYELTPTDIRVEVTESSVIENKDVAFGLLPEIKAHGFLLCMDDFGTGYSSLSYLSELPFDVLKIDRSFIHEISRRSELLVLVRTVLGLSRELGMMVVAEGIETEDQQTILGDLDCGYGQGYRFAKPMPAQDATRWLQEALPRQIAA